MIAIASPVAGIAVTHQGSLHPGYASLGCTRWFTVAGACHVAACVTVHVPMRFGPLSLFALLSVVGCGSQTQRTGTITLRAGCPAAGCPVTGDGPQRLAASQKALAEFNVEAVKTELDAAAATPLDYKSYVSWWEHRGIAAAYVEDEKTASAAFDMLLALDPRHLLSYTLSPKATFVFEKVRGQERTEAALDINWPRDLKVGSEVPLDIEVVADPKAFLKRARLFVRERGASDWRAADFAITIGKTTRLRLPGINKKSSAALELYLQAYDDKGNTVLTWADPKRPREIAMRYEPPTPWFRKWWVWAAAGTVVAGATGAIVFTATNEPPSRVGGSVVVN